MRRIFSAAAAVAVFAVLTQSTPANAALTLKLTQGVSTVTVVDGDGDGAVTFNGVVGNYNINVSTGLSKPVFPASPTFGKMDLNSVNVSGGSGGLLVIELSDNDFPAFPSPGVLGGMVGGTTNGTVEAWAYKNDSNVLFDTVSPEADVHLGPFTAGAFSGTASDTHGPLGPYSMTLVVNINHAPGTGVSSSFDFEVVNTVPAPAGLILAATAVPFLGLLRRRMRKPEVTTAA
jgi:hypothetical protein